MLSFMNAKSLLISFLNRRQLYDIFHCSSSADFVISRNFKLSVTIDLKMNDCVCLSHSTSLISSLEKGFFHLVDQVSLFCRRVFCRAPCVRQGCQVWPFRGEKTNNLVFFKIGLASKFLRIYEVVCLFKSL